MLSALEVDILTTLLNRELYGIQLLEKINRARRMVGYTLLRSGSLYPKLNNLEKKRIILSKLEQTKKYYRLSSFGINVLKKRKEYLRLLAMKK